MDNIQLLIDIYQFLSNLELKTTPTNVKVLTTIYTKIEQEINKKANMENKVEQDNN